MTKKIVRESDIIYIAGLFDGEGSIQYKQYMRKKPHNKKPYPNWSIRMEIAMTDKEVIQWVAETLDCGTWGERKVQKGRKRQWRWRCGFRDAFFVAKLLWPYAKVKLHKIEQIIDHYTPEFAADQNIVNIDEYKMRKEMMWERHRSMDLECC